MRRTLISLSVSAAFTAAAMLSPALAQTWTAQGPGPTLNAQTQGLPNNPVSGAIAASAIHPTDPNTVYLGAVNGGVWKTSNGLAASPTWSVLTDQALAASSISAVALSPVDPNTVYAGTGSSSSLGSDGSPGIGLAKSTNGGATWSVLAAATFAGKRIISVAPTALPGATLSDHVVMAAVLRGNFGLYRSVDSGVTFTRISGSAGLPDGGVSVIAADPGNTSRFYAGVPSATLNSGVAGVYRSNDGGANWVPVNTGIPAAVLNNSARLLLSASAAAPNPVYAAAISSDVASGIAPGHLSGVFRSANLGATWSSLGLPSPEIFPGGQGGLHGAIAALPTNANAVIVSGDRQANPFTNGCTNFTANSQRNDSGVWSALDCNGASGTSPHADSRAIAFEASGHMLQSNDGGIYRLLNPDAAANVRSWASVNANVQPTEMHSVAYDPFSNILFGGTQDTGATIQSAPGSAVWNEFLQGDGAKVAVDADQTAHAGTSIRYTSSQRLGNFNRSSWNAANSLGPFAFIPLNISGGTTVFNDPNLQFYTPFVLNKINPARMLMGTANIYESFDKGDNVDDLGFRPFFISALAYGGKFNNTANPDVFYVAGGPEIRRRTTSGGGVTTLASPGGNLRAVAMDPENHKRVFVVDTSSRVWMSQNEGNAGSWINLTANLPTLSPDIRAVEVFGTDPNGRTTRLLVGGQGGVFEMRRPGASGTTWTLLGSSLPRTLVYDIHYDYTDQVLVAGTLGRGAWLLNNPFAQPVAGPAPVTTTARSTTSAPSAMPVFAPQPAPVPFVPNAEVR